MEERGADQEVQIPGAEWLQRNVHQHVQGQQMNGSSFKTPILAGLGRREGWCGGGLEEGPSSALLLWQGTGLILNNVILWYHDCSACYSNLNKNKA